MPVLTIISTAEAKNLINEISNGLRSKDFQKTLDLMVKENFHPACSIYLLHDKNIILNAIDLLQDGFKPQFTDAKGNHAYKEGFKIDELESFFRRISEPEKTVVQYKSHFQKYISQIMESYGYKEVKLPKLYEMRKHLYLYLQICIWIELWNQNLTTQYDEIVKKAIFERFELQERIRKHRPDYKWVNVYDWPGNIDEFQKYVRHGLTTSNWELPGKWTKPLSPDLMAIREYYLHQKVDLSQQSKKDKAAKKNDQSSIYENWNHLQRIEMTPINAAGKLYKVVFCFKGRNKKTIIPEDMGFSRNGKLTKDWDNFIALLLQEKTKKKNGNITPKQRSDINQKLKGTFNVNAPLFFASNWLNANVVEKRRSKITAPESEETDEYCY